MGLASRRSQPLQTGRRRAGSVEQILAAQVLFHCVTLLVTLCSCCGEVAFSGSYQKWQRTDDNWKGKYAQGSYHKGTATFKGKCNKCGERGHKQSECPKAQGQEQL
mgnify:CR=1 FL=1